MRKFLTFYNYHARPIPFLLFPFDTVEHFGHFFSTLEYRKLEIAIHNLLHRDLYFFQ